MDEERTMEAAKYVSHVMCATLLPNIRHNIVFAKKRCEHGESSCCLRSSLITSTVLASAVHGRQTERDARTNEVTGRVVSGNTRGDWIGARVIARWQTTRAKKRLERRSDTEDNVRQERGESRTEI
jgi:hypothetical protein